MNKCLAESGIDPTDIQNVMQVSYAKRNISSHESSRQIQTHQRYVFARVNQSKHHNCDDLDPTDTPSAVPTALQAPSDATYNPKCTHSLMETQCNHSKYPILMKQNCTHNPSTSQVSKSYHPNPVTFPYPPDPGEHVLETSSAPTTLVDRIPSTTPGAEPPRDARDSGSARSHSTHLETSSSDRPKMVTYTETQTVSSYMSVKGTRRTLRMPSFMRATHAQPSLSNFPWRDSDFWRADPLTRDDPGGTKFSHFPPK